MLFTNKLKVNAVVEKPADYESALEYLIGLSGDDYTKICQVAAIQRQANHEANVVLGRQDQPFTFIEKPQSTIRLEDVKIPYIDNAPKSIRKINKTKKAKK